MTLYIGLMSGTSMDGIDGLLVDFPDGPATSLRVIADAHVALCARRLQQIVMTSYGRSSGFAIDPIEKPRDFTR